MSELVIAIILGVTITLTGCTNAGESTVSDYEQGGYFKEEHQIKQEKEVEKPKTNTNTTQSTKINDKQQTESKQNNNKTNNQQHNNKSTKGADNVNNNSNKQKDEPKQNNQSTQQDTEQTDTLECAICGYPVHNGEGIVVSGTLLHKSCYQQELDDYSKYNQ